MTDELRRVFAAAAEAQEQLRQAIAQLHEACTRLAPVHEKPPHTQQEKSP